MRRWDNDLKVGTLVVIGVILLGILLTMAPDWTLGAPGKELTVHFPHLQNLKKGAHTQLSGVAVGKVTQIRLDESGYGEVVMRIESPFELREGLKAELQTLGVVGETIVMLTNGDPNAPPLDWSKPVIGSTAFLTDMLPRLNETIDQLTAFLSTFENVGAEAQRDFNQLSEAAVHFMGDMSEKADALVDQTGAAAEELSEALTALEALERLPALFERADALMAQTQALMAQAEKSAASIAAGANETLTHASEALKASRGELETLSSEIRLTLRSAQASLETAEAAADGIESTLAQTADSAAAALNAGQERVFETLSRLDESAADIQRFAQRLDRIAAEAEAGKGSIGRLLTDDSLAVSATEAVKSIEALTAAAAAFGTGENPLLSGGAEIGYRGVSESLQSEALLTFQPWENLRVDAALGSRDSTLLYSLTVAQKTGRFWGRLGVIDSKAALGIDWMPHERALLRVEALNATQPLRKNGGDLLWPRIDAEVGFQLWKRGQLILGGEDLTEKKRGFVFGVRTHY